MGSIKKKGIRKRKGRKNQIKFKAILKQIFEYWWAKITTILLSMTIMIAITLLWLREYQYNIKIILKMFGFNFLNVLNQSGLNLNFNILWNKPSFLWYQCASFPKHAVLVKAKIIEEFRRAITTGSFVEKEILG